MPSLEFTLLVDAVKLPNPQLVPRNATYQLQWFYSELHHGVSSREVPMKDEVDFMMSAKWLIENRVAVGKILQISLFQCSPKAEDERELIGVLMIDLNAHIPKPPQRYSRQRATLSMSRCPYDTPVMIRLTVECVHSQLSVGSNQLQQQMSASPVPLQPSVTAASTSDSNKERGQRQQQRSSEYPVGAAHSNNNTYSDPVATSQPSSNKNRGAANSNTEAQREDFSGSGFVPIDRNVGSQATAVPKRHSASPSPQNPQSIYAATPQTSNTTGHYNMQPTAEKIHRSEDELLKLKATISTMAAANEQLRDENHMLRKAASQARKEPDYTYTVDRPGKEGGGGSGEHAGEGRAGSSSYSQELEVEIQRLRAESVTQRAEIVVLQKGVMASKEQLKAQMEREQELRAEISSLSRSNAHQMETIRQLENELDEARIKPVGAGEARGGEIETVRSHLRNAQQAVRDLTSIKHSSEETIQTLRVQLDETQVQLRESENRRVLSEQECTKTIQENERKVERCEAALRLGQREISRLHAYCEEANERCKSMSKAMDAQRVALERKKKKLNDLRAFINAHEVFSKFAH